MQTKEQAAMTTKNLKDVLPSCWRIMTHNVESRPRHPGRYNVVATSGTGLTIAADAETGRYHVTINTGLRTESVSSRMLRGTGYATADVAYDRLRGRVRDLHDRISKQITSVL